MARRRQGVASAVLDAALAWARDQPGIGAVDLTVWEFDNEARGFETLVRHVERPLG